MLVEPTASKHWHKARLWKTFPIEQAVLTREQIQYGAAWATETTAPYLSLSPHTAWMESILDGGNVKQTMGGGVFLMARTQQPSPGSTGTTALLKEI